METGSYRIQLLQPHSFSAGARTARPPVPFERSDEKHCPPDVYSPQIKAEFSTRRFPILPRLEPVGRLIKTTNSRMKFIKIYLLLIPLIIFFPAADIVGQIRCPFSPHCAGKLIAEGGVRVKSGETQIPAVRLEVLPVDNSKSGTNFPADKIYKFRFVISPGRTAPGNYVVDWDRARFLADEIAPGTFVINIYAKYLPASMKISFLKMGRHHGKTSLILSDILSIPDAYRAQPAAAVPTLVASKPIITLQKLKQPDLILMTLTIPGRPCSPKGILNDMTVGDEPANVSCRGTDFCISFTPEDFAKIKDGAEIAFTSFGFTDSISIQKDIIGKLDKTTLK